ncbi:MAG TPA: EamA family transporter [Polyangia bacterium]|nr:EamA family transporter [Polyangia bacterium]
MSTVSSTADLDTASSRRATFVMAFAAIYLIWGSTYLAIRVGVRTLPPFLMSSLRFLAAGGALFAILRARGVAKPTRTQWKGAAIAGLLMLTAGNGLVTWAEKRLPSNLTALLVAGVPLYTALLDWLRPGGVAPARRVLAGIGVGAVGMALLVASGGDARAPAPSVAAILAIVVSGLCWAAGSLYARYGEMHPDPVMAAAQEMLVGGTTMFVVSALRGEPQHLVLARVSTESLLALAYLALFGSLVAFSAFGWLVKATSPANLATTAFVNPVVAVVLGGLILGESLGPRALAGAALILGAVVVMLARRRVRYR